MQNSAITVYLPRELCRRRAGYRPLCEFFTRLIVISRNFILRHWEIGFIRWGALFAGFNQEMKDD
jgi:hypothetical protein